MAEKRVDPERSEVRSPNPMLMEWAELGAERIKVRVEELINVQTEFFDKFQEASCQWLDRAQSEANCVSEFAAKLTAARSLPEALVAYQEWTAREIEMISHDGQHLLDNVQKFMDAGIRLLRGYLYVTRCSAE